MDKSIHYILMGHCLFVSIMRTKVNLMFVSSYQITVNFHNFSNTLPYKRLQFPFYLRHTVYTKHRIRKCLLVNILKLYNSHIK